MYRNIIILFIVGIMIVPSTLSLAACEDGAYSSETLSPALQFQETSLQAIFPAIAGSQIAWEDYFSQREDPAVSMEDLLSAKDIKAVFDVFELEFRTTIGNTEVTFSLDHDYMYYWVTDNIKKEKWGTDIVVLNFDYHPDDHNKTGKVDLGNWAGYLKKEGKISEYWWVASSLNSFVTYEIPHADFKTGSLSTYPLPHTDKPVVVTIDMDYFLCSNFESNRFDPKYIERQIKNLIMCLQERKFNIIGLNITLSPEYIFTDSRVVFTYQNLVKGLGEYFAETDSGADIPQNELKDILSSLGIKDVSMDTFRLVELSGEWYVTSTIGDDQIHFPLNSLADAVFSLSEFSRDKLNIFIADIRKREIPGFYLFARLFKGVFIERMFSIFENESHPVVLQKQQGKRQQCYLKVAVVNNFPNNQSLTIDLYPVDSSIQTEYLNFDPIDSFAPPKGSVGRIKIALFDRYIGKNKLLESNNLFISNVQHTRGQKKLARDKPSFKDWNKASIACIINLAKCMGITNFYAWDRSKTERPRDAYSGELIHWNNVKPNYEYPFKDSWESDPQGPEGYDLWIYDPAIEKTKELFLEMPLVQSSI
ncbi:MAG: hypothetical protein GY853_05925 [PVC group bacterium]|nr:hypothetical protein [PVC group bacterium]